MKTAERPAEVASSTRVGPDTGTPRMAHKFCPACQPEEGTITAYCGWTAERTATNRTTRASIRCNVCIDLTNCSECGGD